MGFVFACNRSPQKNCPQVDFMLGSYMEDIGITAKEFEAACTQGKSITGKFHQQLFEQVSSFIFNGLSTSHAKCRFGLQMTMRFSRG